MTDVARQRRVVADARKEHLKLGSNAGPDSSWLPFAQYRFKRKAMLPMGLVEASSLCEM